VAWSWLQSASGVSGSAATTLAVTYATANLSSGTKLIAAVAVNAGVAVTTSTVKDGAGNSFTKLATQSFNNANPPGELTLWAIDTPAGDVGTKPTITATFSTSAIASLLIQEVSGLATGSTLAAMIDGTPGTNFGSNGASTGSPTYSSTAANEYLVSVYGDDGGPETWTKPAALTADTASVNSNASGDIAIAYGNSTSGAEAGSWSLTGSAALWSTVLCAFKIAAAAAPAAAPYSFPQMRTELARGANTGRIIRM
jgi:hypothetical protein